MFVKSNGWIKFQCLFFLSQYVVCVCVHAEEADHCHLLILPSIGDFIIFGI